jgi:hypothetical protein
VTQALSKKFFPRMVFGRINLRYKHNFSRKRLENPPKKRNKEIITQYLTGSTVAFHESSVVGVSMASDQCNKLLVNNLKF